MTPPGSAPQISHAAPWNSSGSPSVRNSTAVRGSGSGVTRDRATPKKSAGTATTKPAIGPGRTDVEQDRPWSEYGRRIRMKAPIVPVRQVGHGEEVRQ